MAAADFPGFEVSNDTVIWRYLALTRYRELLSGRLYFAAAQQFGDHFEGAITAAQHAWRRREAARTFPDDVAMQERDLDGLTDAFADLRRMTKISCWHARATENIAMWERYLQGSPGVAVASTVGALKR